MYFIFQGLYPHDDLYPSQYDRVLDALSNSNTGQIAMSDYQDTIADCNSSGMNLNRILQADNLYSIMCNVKFPHGQCSPITDPDKIHELAKELQPHL